MRHPSIVRLEAVYETRQSMYIVLEKVNGGELFSRIVGRARFSESEARALMKPLLEAVAYIHSMGIMHRDIKVCVVLAPLHDGDGAPTEGVEWPLLSCNVGDVCVCECRWRLQPENILCGDRVVDIKLADFGLSHLVNPHEPMHMPCGTLSYVGGYLHNHACTLPRTGHGTLHTTPRQPRTLWTRGCFRLARGLWCREMFSLPALWGVAACV